MTLSRLGLVRLAPGRTARQLLGSVGDADFRKLVAPTLRHFESAYYGHRNPSGEEFGPDRLQEVVSNNLGTSAAGIRDKIEAALTKFAQGTPAVDDITLVIVKRAQAER